jgi:hypothetical protein
MPNTKGKNVPKWARGLLSLKICSLCSHAPGPDLAGQVRSGQTCSPSKIQMLSWVKLILKMINTRNKFVVGCLCKDAKHLKRALVLATLVLSPLT